jgi:hypothetical protein
MCSVISTLPTLDRQEKRLIDRKFEKPAGLETGVPSGPNASDFTAIKAFLKSTVLNENLGTPKFTGMPTFNSFWGKVHVTKNTSL